MTEAEKKLLIDLQGLLFFKSKQDNENLEKFIKKDDALGSLGAISYLIKQNLTEDQKAQARENIGAAAVGQGGNGTTEGAVLYTKQDLTDSQKTIARENIGTTDGTWENMPDKPFYKNGYKYEWDGNTTGLETFGVVEGFDFYKISSDVLSEAELLGASVKSYFDGNDIEGEISQDGIINVTQTAAGNLLVGYGTSNNGLLPLIFVCNKIGEDTVFEIAFTINSTGLWLLRGPGEKEYIRYLQKNYEVKKIDKEFLPDDMKVELPEGLVTTDENGLIPASVLPSYVDDVIEGYYKDTDNEFFKTNAGAGILVDPISPESGKIYIDLLTGNTYRWSGSVYVQLNPKEYTIATNADIDALFT